MIKLQSLTIKNFRGIKELTIPFQGKSWVIHGRNGSGKSGVVDAIEYALSGQIGRLLGEGRGDVSIKAHGPHVDFKDDPKSAIVEAELIDVNMRQNTIKIVRDCSNPSKPKITFDNKTNAQKFEPKIIGKELVLSRREILKFILSEPGKRSKEIQALLQLYKIEEIRSALQSTKNKIDRNLNSANQEFNHAKSKLKEWLNIEELNPHSTLSIINGHRQILNLEPVSSIDENTKIFSGEKTENSPISLNKEELSQELTIIKSQITDKNKELELNLEYFLSNFSKLSEKQAELNNLNKLGFYESGLNFLGQGVCPFCSTNWDDKELRSLITDKIEEISGVKNIQSELLTQTNFIKNYWKQVHIELENFISKISVLKDLSLTELIKARNEINENLQFDIYDFEKLNNLLISKPENLCISNYNELVNEISLIQIKILQLPEKSKEENSIRYLSICQERLDNYWEYKRKYEYHQSKLEISEKILNKFNSIVEEKLNSLYKDIENDFSRFYQIVNQDDESDFSSDLTITGKGSLDFKVNFYGRGKFPPAAYHSEGHQDGMGLCLYLALMKKILGSHFTLAILDDVLMSIDSAHRKSFCKLLKQEFNDTQFIITTHDEYWKKQMITEGLVSHSTTLHFKNWSVDTGPTVWNEQDSWSEIEQFISQENIPSASHTLRRFLEYFMDEISVVLAASIPRSASGAHDLGELLSGVTCRYGDLLKRAKKAARSWNNKEMETKYGQEKSEFDDCLKKANSEMWGINATVHFNSWANMGTDDFVEIKNAFFNLVKFFKCDKCNTLLHIIPNKGASETLKCDCGQRFYNLKEKK
ncbi:TPA: AAA family ATPase [Legionella anisa]